MKVVIDWDSAKQFVMYMNSPWKNARVIDVPKEFMQEYLELQTKHGEMQAKLIELYDKAEIHTNE